MVVANHQPFTDTPVVINVGKGHFVTHLNFPDMSYPEPMLTISGVSAAATVLSANASGPVLFALADAPKIIVQDLTVTDQSVALHDGGNFMDFIDVIFSNNSPGGALFDDGGSVQVTGSTFTGNSFRATTTGGGAVSQTGGTLVVTGSLFTGNTVNSTNTTGVGSGGAIYVSVGHLEHFRLDDHGAIPPPVPPAAGRSGSTRPPASPSSGRPSMPTMPAGRAVW